MKQWPKEKTASIEDVMPPIRAALDIILARGKDNTETIPYDGYEFFSNEILASIPNVNNLFHHDGLEYDKERGHDALDVLLQVVYLLGTESGRLQERFNEGRISCLEVISINLEETQRYIKALLKSSKVEPDYKTS